MKEQAPQSELYWYGGPFQPRIDFSPPHYVQGIQNVEAMAAASEVLKTFISTCQRHYFAFHTAVSGIRKMREQTEGVFLPEHLTKTVFIGRGPPDTEPLPGSSTVGQMGQGELLDSLKEGGTFENFHAKAFVVIVFHLWDESCRKEIADALEVKTGQVTCSLMGDLRLMRNLIIHNQSVIPEDFPKKVQWISQIWSLDPGDMQLTGAMVNSLIEQLNAMRVSISTTS